MGFRRYLQLIEYNSNNKIHKMLTNIINGAMFVTYEPVHEKTNNLGFRPGLTQTGLYSHRTLLEAGNFVFK